MPERDAESVGEFCTRHNISRGLFYRLLREKRGPKVMKLGWRTLISKEASAAWRKSLEQ